MKYTLPADQKALRTMTDKAIKSAQTMRNLVQQASIAILHHAFKCGDYTEANYLVEGLGHGVKRDSLVEFFVKFGGLKIDEDAQAFSGWQGKDYIKANFEDAKKQMWWDLIQTNPFKGFDIDEKIGQLLKAAAKTHKKLDGMPEEHKEMVHMTISAATMKALMQYSEFEAIIPAGGDATNDDTAVIEALEKQIG